MNVIETHNCEICPCFIFKTCDNCPEYNLLDDCDVRNSWENRCSVNDCIEANKEEKSLRKYSKGGCSDKYE